MIRSVLCLVCNNILVDPRSPLLTTVHLFDSFIPPAYPVQIMTCFVVALERDLTDVDSFEGIFTVTLNEEVVLSEPMVVNFAGSRFARSARLYLPLEVLRPCEARFSLTHGNTRIASYGFSFFPVPLTAPEFASDLKPPTPWMH